MGVLEEEKAIIAALDKLKSYKSKKKVLEALKFDEAEINKLYKLKNRICPSVELLGKAIELLKKQINAISVAINYFQNKGLIKKNSQEERTRQLLKMIETQLIQCYNELLKAQPALRSACGEISLAYSQN